jgi:AraC family transcriptional regulator of adaptative response / DNA-3-methyladenine glycosylase II
VDELSEARYRAVRSRDARFDGRFFTGVTSTGIYCRPVCPARTPRRENVRFYRWAAAAESDGFRPCRRCRPEVSPDSPEWDRRADLVGRALRLIAAGAVDTDGVHGLAARLGTSERHLQRVVGAEVGVTPGVLARSRRAALARRLLRDTDLEVTAVAFAAGFSSIRTFNETMRTLYDATPTQVRQWADGHPALPGDGLRLHLATRAPFDGGALLAHLAARATPGIEDVDGTLYRRSLSVGGRGVVIEVDVGDDGVDLWLPAGSTTPVTSAVAAVRRLFDLDAEPAAIADDLCLAGESIAQLVRRHRGVRVPGAVDGFETAVRIVLGQQVSVAAATTHAGRLAADLGELLDSPDGSITRLFPTPAAVAQSDLRALAMPSRRRDTVRALAEAVASGGVVLDGSGDPGTVRRRLLAIPGIGPWTADVIALRVLRDPDVMPFGDRGVRAALAVDGRRPTAAEVAEMATRWRPWRSYAAQLLWTGARNADGSEETR